MGRWMEVLRNKPPESERHHDDRYERLVVDAIAPHPLLDAVAALRRAGLGEKQAQSEFPAHCRIQIDSVHYEDEDLWLDRDEARDLLDELTRMRRITRRQEFITSIDGELVMEIWKDHSDVKEFEEHLDHIERVLRLACESEYWVRIML